MKVTETITRECCQDRDLKPVAGTPLPGGIPKLKFCVHCGARHELQGVLDAAGSRDWEYRKVHEKWNS